MEFFESMEPLLRVLWYTAIPVSLVFIIQSIMTFMGMDGHDGADVDMNSDLNDGSSSFQFLTFQNLINFLLGFSWSGISFYNIIGNKFLLISIAFITGILFVSLFIYLMLQIYKLSEDNSFRIDKTLQKTGSVYLAIPGNKTGKGKIQVSVNGAFHELDAMTEMERIETGAMIRVIKVEDNNLVVVEKI